MTNCLVIIRNKKLNIDYARLESFMRVFSSACRYFDKVSVIGFDDPKLISEQLTECRSSCENAVVVCCDGQFSVISDYLQRIYGGVFDGLGMLSAGRACVCLGRIEDGEAFAERCVRFLNERDGRRYDKFYIKCISAPGELIRESIDRAGKAGADTAFAVYDRFGDQTIEISYSSNTPKMTADSIQRELVCSLGQYIYALENISIERRLYDLLKLRRMKLSVSESFTGGGVSSRLVSVPGMSEVYFEGLNTYANRSKIERLGVDEMTLKQYGAVSDRTACEMVEGLLRTGNCDVALSTTGIAGPASDNTSKPVGLAYIGVGTGDDIKVYKFNYKGDRERITRTAINDALFLVYKMLK